jgi:retinol dehydrogenase-14
MVRSAPSRIVTVASVAHRHATMNLDDLGFEKGYSIVRSYARSKLANVLFASELARRLEGTGVTSNSVHPGAVATNIWSGAPGWAKPVIFLALRPFFLSAEKGATFVVNLVADPKLEGVTGKYFEEAKEIDPSPLGRDPVLARRLWETSAELVHLPSPF